MADLPTLLAQGTNIDPLGAIQKAQQIKGSRLANLLRAKQIEQLPQQQKLQDLQVQRAEQVLKAGEQAEVDRLDDRNRALLAEKMDQIAFIAGQTSSKDQLIKMMQGQGLEPDPQILDPSVDHPTAVQMVSSKSKAFREAALRRALKPQRFGAGLEAISQSKFGKPFGELTQTQQQQALKQEQEGKEPLVVIGDKAERKAIAGIQAKRFEKIVNDAEGAKDALDNINQLESLDVRTGALEPAKASFAAVIESLGFDASGIANVANAQAFEGVSNRMVNDVLNRAKGPQTEGDAKRARSTLAALGNTPQANQFLNSSLKALALRQIERAEFIESIMEQDKTFSEANKQWNAFKRKTPSLSDIVKTQSGIPMFFYQFKERAQRIRPGITDEQIINAWRSKHGR